jgi:MYXO-CTERM domain-containing protein
VRVPTLEAFFAAVEGDVNVEVKLHEDDHCPGQDLDELADGVMAAIAADPRERYVIVSSFDLEVLRRIRAGAPSVPLAYLATSADDIDLVSEEGFEAINLFSVVANARAVGRARDAGVELNVWTVNGEEAVRRMLDLHVDGVITDTADAAFEVRAAWCANYTCPGPDAGVDAGADPEPGPGGGCGCRATSSRPSPLWALAPLAALAWRARRRR